MDNITISGPAHAVAADVTVIKNEGARKGLTLN